MINPQIEPFQQSEFRQSKQFQQPAANVNRSYALCFLLYFLQGNVISIGLTMPYLYKQLPSYKTLALFSTIDFPFSFKFIFTPFLEKYTNLTYGKRKTWIIISQIICSIILFFSSFFTQIGYATIIPFFLMCSQLFITIQDISLDSLSIKQTRSPQKASLIQSISQPLGTVIGSLILLKFTSLEFASKIGLESAISTPTVIIRCISLLLIITAIMMHLFFKETHLDCEKRGKDKKLCEIVSYSKTFLHINSRYCRTVIFLLIYYQGLKFYEAGYDYQLIKAGFSRDTSNSISNLISLPVIALTFLMTGIISKLGMQKALKYVLLLLCILYAFNIHVFSLNPRLVIFTQFIGLILITFKNMVLYMMINSFPLHGLSGMFITIMLSLWNLGELKTLNTLIIDIFGWTACAYLGLLIQVVIIMFLPNLFKWIDEGVVEIDSSISQFEDGQKIDQQNTLPFTYFDDQEQEKELKSQVI